MSPRRRGSSRRDWPANLYCRDGYYSWRDPRSREEHGLGRITKPEAFTQAIEANLHLAKMLNRPRLIDRLTGEADRSLGAWVARYLAEQDTRKLADNTRKGYRSYAKRTLEAFDSGMSLKAITALMVADQLETVEGTRTGQAWRSFLRDMFRAAIVRGWVDENPVRAVKLERVEVKRSRLTLDVYRQIREAAALVWLRNAMDLALVSGQRREDVARATASDVRDGHWWVDQGKTGARIALPLSLTLTAANLNLGDVVRRCRQTGVLSRHLIHQTEQRGNSPKGSPIWIDTISRRFTDVLAELGLTFDGKPPPTFHEIRSLSARLYSAQGDVDVKTLLGHKDAATTAVYQDGRGIAWTKLIVGE